MVPDHGTQYEEYPSSQHGGMRKDSCMDRRLDKTLSYIPQFHLNGVAE